MTVAEYQQAQKDIAEIRGQIAQLRDVVAKGVPAMRGVYGLDQPEEAPNDFSGSPIDLAMQEQQAKNKNFADTSLLGNNQQPASTTAVVPQDPTFTAGASNIEQALGTSGMDDLRYRERASIGNPEDVDALQAGDKPIMRSVDESATAFGASMADAATMGLTGEQPKKFQRAIDQSPISSFAGTMAGYAPAFMGLDLAAGVAIPAIAGKGITKNVARGAIAGGTQDTADQLVRTGEIDPTRSAASMILGAGADFLIPAAARGFKSIKEARAAINDIGKPKVDVPEVVQEPIRSETPVEQPTSAAEVVGKAEPTTKKSFEMTMYHGTDAENIDAFDVSDRQYGTENKNPLGDNIGAFFTTKKESAQGFGKNVVSRKIQLGNPKVFNSYDDFKTFLRENTSPNDGLEWKVSEYQDAPGEYFSEGRNADGVIADSKNFSDRADAERYVESKTKNNTKQGGQQLLKDMGYDGVVIKNPFIDTKTKEVWAIAFDNKSIVDGVPTDIPAKQPTPTTATEVVAKAKPNAVTKDVKTLTPEELTAAQARLREKFKPMDEATKPQTPQVITEDLSQGAGKISTEQPTAVQDAGATPAQSINTAEAVVKKAGGIETPLSGAKEIKSELNTTKIGHKQFKSEINDRLDKMIADAPPLEQFGISSLKQVERVGGDKYSTSLTNMKDLEQYGVNRVEIEIPGDGTFRIWNTKEHLSELKKLANRAKLPGEDEALRKWAPYNQGLSDQLARNAVKNAKASKAPTELHAGVNPFKIIDDYMTKRKLVNPLGTPEHVLSGKGIVEPFRKAQEAIRNETKLRGESLQETLKGIKRWSDEDVELFRKLNDPKSVLNEREQAIRNYLDDFLNTVNEHRVARGQDPVKYRKGYITHLLDAVEKNAEQFGEIPMPKRYRFQFEQARKNKAGYRVSALDAIEVYTKAALKDIHIGDALHKTIPIVESLGDKPIVRRSMVKTPDGKTINMTFYDWTNSPIMTERGYAESFIKGQMNIPTVGQRNLEAMLGIKPNTASKTAMAVTARFYQSLLGLAIDSSVKNLTQGINTMAEMGVLPTLKGYAKLATAKGLKTAKAEHLLEDFNPLLMEGADLPFKTKTARAIGKGFSATMNAPMKVAEFINRGAAYHAAYDVYIKKGMSLEQAHEAARAAVRKTQFSYSKIDTSPALRGPFARTFSQFFSYPLKQSEMMYKWATKPGEQGKLVRYFLYTGMAVVGAKYGGVDLSGVFFDPIRMVDPNSKEGFQLPGTDKRVKIDPSKLGKSGYTPQGFAPSISIPYDFIKSQMSDDESAREYGREKALTNIIPGGRYGKKVYDVITESDEKGKRDRLTRENTTKDKVLKLLGGRSTDREAESSRRELASEVEKKYYATRQKLIDLKISGNEDEFIKLRDEFRDRYPFLYGRLMKGFGDAVKEERKKKGMTTDERFFDNSLRKQIDANL